MKNPLLLAALAATHAVMALESSISLVTLIAMVAAAIFWPLIRVACEHVEVVGFSVLVALAALEQEDREE